MNTGNELQLLQRTFGSEKVRYLPLGLDISEDLTFEEWSAVGSRLERMGKMVNWWLGDCLAFGDRKYGRLKEFAEANGINPGTLMNLVRVSRAVELSRRRENLDWCKHAEVAKLGPKEQSKWLDKAVAEDLTVSQLRSKMRIADGEDNALVSDGPVIKFGLKAADDLKHWLLTRPAEFWSPERCAAVREELKPIVDFYEKLKPET